MSEPQQLFLTLNKFNGLVNSEGDRSAALLVAAYLEEQLEALLLAYLLDVPAAKLLVCGFNAPLGTFSSRCKAAYALGLISSVQFKDIERIRKIRNEFAHNWDLTSFDDTRVIGTVRSITPSRIEEPKDKTNLREHFILAARQVMVEIECLTSSPPPGAKRFAQQSVKVSISEPVGMRGWRQLLSELET